MRRAARTFLAAALCLGLTPVTWNCVVPEQAQATTLDTMYWETYPSAYYLTNEGYVTPAKLQSPWGSCWAFAVASALESSILKATDALVEQNATTESAEPMTEPEASQNPPVNTTTGVVTNTAEEAEASGSPTSAANAEAHATLQLANLPTSVDISERAIAWMVHEVQTEESGGKQAGEGYRLIDPHNLSHQLGEGNFEMIEAQLVAGQSIVAESTVPYQYNDYNGSPLWHSLGSSSGANDDARVYDWSVDPSLRTTDEVGWRVSDVYRLSDPAVLELDHATGSYKYIGYNSRATQAIKGALLNVGAVAITLESDSYLPSDVIAGNSANAAPSETFTYSTWSQYNGADEVFSDHAVTIVGWDDEYSASNFAGTQGGRPPANGAWLCKNNWGSDNLYAQAGTNSTSDATRWGIVDETGAASGFFWLSYYDHSITNPVAFAVEPVSENFDVLYQHDYLGPSEYSSPSVYPADVWVANAFTVNDTEVLKAISAQTFNEDENVNIEVYIVPPEVNLEKASASDVFAHARLVAQQNAEFEQAGFHRIELDKPVMVNKDEHFIVAEKVDCVHKNIDGTLYSGSYLNLELAYTEGIEGGSQAMMATVIANPGETYVSISDTKDENHEAAIANSADGMVASTTESANQESSSDATANGTTADASSSANASTTSRLAKAGTLTPAPKASWMTVAEYNDAYAVALADIGAAPDVVFGNALIKAFADTTTIGERGQVYEQTELLQSIV